MSETQSLTSQVRALFNPLILENVFKFLPIKELSECRLVCKLWHYVSTPFWSEVAGPITLYEYSRDAVFERNKHMTLTSFVSLYKISNQLGNSNDLSLSGWPYRRFKLLFFRDLSCGPSKIKQFWIDCGPWITDLQVFGCRLHDFPAYKDLLLCKYTPNVKNFKFSCQYDGIVQSENSSTTCITAIDANINLKNLGFYYCMPKVGWMELFSKYPNIEVEKIHYKINLTSFELSSPYRLANWDNELVKMLECIRNLRMNNTNVLSLLMSLNIHVAGVDQNPTRDQPIRISDLLFKTKLPLESLSLDAHLFRGEVNRGQIDSIFSMYQATLKRLKIRDSLCESPLSFPSVVMTSLKELIITGGSFQNMSILKFTPNLTLLHIINPFRSRAMDRYMLKGFIQSTEYLNLEFLCDFRYDFDCTPCNMLNLLCWMPNVEVLDMPLTNETFRMVCKHWRKLKQLAVQKDALTDDGICGVIKYDDQLMNTTAKLNEHQLNKLQPDITDLKELRSFVMENHRYNHDDMENAISQTDILPTKLTEKSILHGFLKLPLLQKLSIIVEIGSVSTQLLTSLKNKIKHVNVVQMHHPFRHRLH